MPPDCSLISPVMRNSTGFGAFAAFAANSVVSNPASRNKSAWVAVGVPCFLLSKPVVSLKCTLVPLWVPILPDERSNAVGYFFVTR